MRKNKKGYLDSTLTFLNEFKRLLKGFKRGYKKYFWINHFAYFNPKGIFSPNEKNYKARKTNQKRRKYAH